MTISPWFSSHKTSVPITSKAESVTVKGAFVVVREAIVVIVQATFVVTGAFVVIGRAAFVVVTAVGFVVVGGAIVAVIALLDVNLRLTAPFKMLVLVHGVLKRLHNWLP